MKNRAFRALEFIGDDLIRRAKEDTEEEVPRRRVWTKGIAIAASLVLIVGGASFVLLRQGGADNMGKYLSPADTTAKDSDVSEQTNSESKPTVPGGLNTSILTSVEEHYSYTENKTAFAAMKIDEFLGIFGDEYEEPYLLVKCTVLEDYYDTIESGTQIVLTVGLVYIAKDDTLMYFDVQAVIDFLSQFDKLFVYTGIPWQQEVYSPETNERDYMEMTTRRFLIFYDILPVSDGKLNLHSLKAFWEEWGANDFGDFIPDFWLYAKDGLDESVFAENIREIKERQIGADQK